MTESGMSGSPKRMHASVARADSELRHASTAVGDGGPEVTTADHSEGHAVVAWPVWRGWRLAAAARSGRVMVAMKTFIVG